MDFAKLAEMLVCPVCKQPLEYDSDPGGYICRSCALVFPIRDEIPVMLVEEAIPLIKWLKDKGE